MSHLLFIVGLLTFAWACSTFDNRWVSKTGLLTLLAATYLGGYFLSGNSHAWGAAAVGLWFVFPWVEILGRVRNLRFPLHSVVKHRFPPSRDVFPDLDEISAEVEDAGFEKTDDAGWKWETTEYFIRLFYHPQKRMQASVSVAQQGAFVFSHGSLTTRTADGLAYVTSNYPFSFTMKIAPLQRMNRCQDVESFEEMIASHEAFLAGLGVGAHMIVEQNPETLASAIQSDLSVQIDHNLSAGVIVRTDAEHFRYSWRGCLFLWLQVVKDMVRV